MKKIILFSLGTLLIFNGIAAKKDSSKKETSKSKYKSATFSGLKFRNIGPALTSGRIADIAVNPNNFSQYYIASASGNVWKTNNAGTTFQPIFDSYGSYSIGCITVDPTNENVVWLGTGENNNQRSVAYGDGIYKSLDGGKSWKNKGLKSSEHIGKIVVHPTNSDIVWVAAMGPLWKEGGERGVYKTEDGGKTWKQVLKISKNTGINDIIIDPRNPNILYAAAQQRRRHVFTYIGGGPESGIYKSTDGGATWRKINKGLPSVDRGRIGLAISPINPDYIFAIVEAANEKGGFYRSTNRGENWEKRSNYTTSGNYYQEIYCDLTDIDKIYAMNTWLHHTEDGGKTFKQTGEKSKHVDNHAMWINPNNPKHWRVGCDGGLYETWDAAKNWQFKANLPITQFYKVAVDNETPFYYIYGGTQDNNSIGGPSRTISSNGIANSDWFITNGGDGFESQIDPIDANVVYAQSQYGGLVRYDKQSGESVGIQPQPKKGEAGLRWNWDAPLLISPHNNKRLYFAANKLFRSEDRGNSWKAISGDLTRQLDRNKLKIMDRVWSMDAVMKNKSTTIFGNIVALDESPKKENLIYVGTDDGLIQISENAGENWTKVASITGVPNQTYVNALVASQHDENVVYAVFNNHKRGDFKPYIFKSLDKGKSWKSITTNLPKRGSVYDIAEDHINPNLLFVGTEFGLFFTIDGGANWTQLKAGLPTIAIRDIEIQKRENDLILASFGRGFYVLDDYTPLRTYSKKLDTKKAHIFPIKDGLMYLESNPLGGREKSNQGESYFTTPNPKVGAVFTYLLNDTLRTLKEKRQKTEAKNKKAGKDNFYPSLTEIRAEDNEAKPYLLFMITNSKGNVIRKLKTTPKAGIHRIVWDFRLASTTPVVLKEPKIGRYSMPSEGPLALPGTYQVALYKSENDVLIQLTEPQSFVIKSLNNNTLAAENKEELVDFQEKVGSLRRTIQAAVKVQNDLAQRMNYAKTAVQKIPTVQLNLMPKINAINEQLHLINIRLNGDYSLSKRDFETAPSIMNRIENVVYNSWYASSAPTQTAKDNYQIAGEEFEPLLNELKILSKKVIEIETELDKAKTPYTPGRFPLIDWKME